MLPFLSSLVDEERNEYELPTPALGITTISATATPFLSGGIPAYGAQKTSDYEKGYRAGNVNMQSMLRFQMAMEKEAENKALAQELQLKAMLLEDQRLREEKSARDLQLLAALKTMNGEKLQSASAGEVPAPNSFDPTQNESALLAALQMQGAPQVPAEAMPQGVPQEGIPPELQGMM